MHHQQTRRSLVLGGLGAAAAVTFPGLHAAAYPDKPVRVMVGYPPGQSTDTITRMWADELGSTLKHPFFVDNRAGAGGTIAAVAVSRSAPDGYNLLGGSGSMAIWPYAYKQPKIDPIADFTYICRTVTVPVILVANNDFAAKDFQQFVEKARKTDTPINYGSGGVGITAHLAMELVKSVAGLKLAHIPYKGSPAALNDLFGGRVDVMFDVATTLLPIIAAGRVRPLAVASPERIPELPNVPTIAESGFPGFEALTWGVFAGPPKLPAPIVQTLGSEMKRILSLPAMKSRFATLGITSAWMSSEDTTAYMRSEAEKWGRVIEQAGIKFE